MILNAKTLEGCELHARDGDVGRIKDIYFDDAAWRVRYFVVETGSWLTGRTVLIAPTALGAPTPDRQRLVVNLTQEQVRNSPAADTTKPVSRQYEEELSRYYAWPHYWTAPMVGGTYVPTIDPAAAPPAAAFRPASAAETQRFGEGSSPGSVADQGPEKPRGDPHLRSAREVRGYHIDATDGAIGHVEDFALDDERWAVRYLIVDTRNWWPGRKVMVSLSQIRDISWPERKVHVDLSREEIKAAPTLDTQGPVPAEYVDRLEMHYRRKHGPTT